MKIGLDNACCTSSPQPASGEPLHHRMAACMLSTVASRVNTASSSSSQDYLFFYQTKRITNPRTLSRCGQGLCDDLGDGAEETQGIRYKLAAVISTISLQLAHNSGLDSDKWNRERMGLSTYWKVQKRRRHLGGGYPSLGVQFPSRTQRLHLLL